MSNDLNNIARMNELIEVLNKASSLYYNGKVSILSDREWDNLYDELQLLEQKTNIILSNSPTRFVGYTVSSEWNKIKHEYPALSLKKTKNREELVSWLKNKTGILSWKLDGLTVVMTYDNGELISLASRGNGIEGEDLTVNAPYIKGIPLKIPYNKHLVVRGEALINYESFKEINNKIEDENEKFKTPRNLTSGSIRNLDTKIVKERNIQVKAFELVYSDDDKNKEYNSYLENMKFLNSIGFDVVEYNVVDRSNILNVIELFEKFTSYSLWPTDGLVLTYDDVNYAKELGTTSKTPLGSIAFKWNDDTYETNVTGIEWSPSRTGALNPVLLFNTVNIDGSDVSRASIHNVNIMKKLQLGIGDTIEVYLANKIIPQVAENNTKTNTFKIPTICPVCGAATEVRISDDGLTEVLYCTSYSCPAKLQGHLELFVSKDGMNIDGLGESALEVFVESGFIQNIFDIYNLKDHAKEIMKLEGFGKRKVEKLLLAIENSKQIYLHQLIRSLGIDLIGVTASKDIAKFCNNDIKNFNQHIINRTDFSKYIDGFGDKMNKSLHDWFSKEENRILYKSISKEIIIVNEDKINKQNENYKDLTGCNFVITGSLVSFENRDQLKDMLVSLNAKVSGSVTSKTTALINNDLNSTSSKNKKAKELNIPIWSEEQLLKFIKE